MKIKVGILFGGYSREREVSFAGGRTVYDNLNKSLFEPVPVFVDSFGNFLILNWQNLYKGSIRDFYPPVDFLPPSAHGFQVYGESLDADKLEMLSSLGEVIKAEELASRIDFAFLCLHGRGGEDGSIQGLLEFWKIPYSGSGIFSSAFGMDKALQRRWMEQNGFEVPAYLIMNRKELTGGDLKKRLSQVKEVTGFPCVIKSSRQGSSIGTSVINNSDYASFEQNLFKAFFREKIEYGFWKKLTGKEKVSYIKRIGDIREGLGFPVVIGGKSLPYSFVKHPEELLKLINKHFLGSEKELIIESVESENEILIEEFLKGQEFSCIVIEDENGVPLALPPTGIHKGKDIYDYRAKYLPGLSRKVTPIELPEKKIEEIAHECCRLYSAADFNVYARIDGFITEGGKILLNDPNTTSGMLPSSFFFHQAAEIGLNPSRFLTYIIRTSLACRMKSSMYNPAISQLLDKTDQLISGEKKKLSTRKKVAVLLGGYSSERHISVESGRNVYEKLSSSEKYEPMPVFVTGDEKKYELYVTPVNILLKDNADDIKEKIENYHVHPYIKKLQLRCREITQKYATGKIAPPRKITFAQLADETDAVFIALHGRPGEDGTIQKELERVGLPYNGSSPSTSAVTIDKRRTNDLFRKNHINVPDDITVGNGSDYRYDDLAAKIGSPFIAKPIDDGCSSAVVKIHNTEELNAYRKLIFRTGRNKKDSHCLEVLHINANEEFPIKKEFLAEQLISKQDVFKLMEITGGLLTHYRSGKCVYEIFEPSETLTGGDVLTLEEKFLAGEGQNITPARFSDAPVQRQKISDMVKAEFRKVAILLDIEGYARIDAFVKLYENKKPEVIFIEVNSLPGMTPATCIFHQAAINGYTPYMFIDKILEYGMEKHNKYHRKDVNI